jgi:hypothetical protein
MVKWAFILGGAVVALTAAASGADAAAIRNVYFSNGTMVEGQSVRSEGQLPGETKVFESGKDQSDGTMVRKMNRNLASLTRADITWRYLWQNFNLQGLAPGVYSIDLMVDDAKAGTYSFTLK